MSKRFYRAIALILILGSQWSQAVTCRAVYYLNCKDFGPALSGIYVVTNQHECSNWKLISRQDSNGCTSQKVNYLYPVSYVRYEYNLTCQEAGYDSYYSGSVNYFSYYTRVNQSLWVPSATRPNEQRNSCAPN